jgi:hypothetical protein
VSDDLPGQLRAADMQPTGAVCGCVETLPGSRPPGSSSYIKLYTMYLRSESGANVRKESRSLCGREVDPKVRQTMIPWSARQIIDYMFYPSSAAPQSRRRM